MRCFLSLSPMTKRSTPPTKALSEWNRRLGVSEDAPESTGPCCRGCGKGLPDPEGNLSGLMERSRFCESCEVRAPFELKVLESGGVRWSCPSYCPSVRRRREQYIGFDDCLCDFGRTWKVAEYMGFFTGRHPVQCVHCRTRHAQHPLVTEKREISHLSRLVRSNWERRMNAEHLQRLQDAGIDFTQSIPTDKFSQAREISRGVVRDGPSMPRGKSYARFPSGWARDPGVS